MEVTKEKSEELALGSELIKNSLPMIDVEYAKAVVKKIEEQASFQDSAAVLNPRYNPEKTKIIRLQAVMLTKLIEFIETGVEINNMKKSAASYENHLDEIQKMFI